MLGPTTAPNATGFTGGGRLSRFSSRHGPLSKSYLADRLRGARSYDRIAGYFRSSIFELVGEEIATIPTVRIVANADLDPQDVAAAKPVLEASLFRRFVENDATVDAALHRGRYERLHELLTSGRVQVRVVPRTVAPFLHGKAGIIRGEGSATAFMGSINETRAAWAHNYELVWEDTSPDGIAWVQEEFDELWQLGKPLPDAIIHEVGRLARRREVEIVSFADEPEKATRAALIEAPIYRDGDSLQPWQRAFVAEFLRHRDIYGRARILLGDEVGVGKTLSLAASAMLSVLLNDGPVLILVPATLTEQWQIELLDRLGMPTARWKSVGKHWVDPQGRPIKGAGARDVARCPYAVGIVSTGLIVHGIDQHGRAKEGTEAEHLLSQRFGTVILDEAHKARGSEELGSDERTPNNLLRFMGAIAARARHVIFSTATPIQTSERDLWDLLQALNEGAAFVLGNDFSPWHNPADAMPYLTGERHVTDLSEGWRLFSNPLPPSLPGSLAAEVRDALDLPADSWITARPSSDLALSMAGMRAEGEMLARTGGHGYFQNDNPLLRHVVLRKRQDLERLGLLKPLPVDVHPRTDLPGPSHLFDGLSLRTSDAFDTAYKAVDSFVRAYSRRDRPTGFMRTLLRQRLCSSHAAGIATANALLGRIELDEEAQEELGAAAFDASGDEKLHLQTLIDALQGGVDPKMRAIRWYLDECRTTSITWREMGCIVFSQYYDTAAWAATQISEAYPDETIALYAGADRSRLLTAGDAIVVKRPQIKQLVADRQLRLVFATDAACEGLNLQTLGTLINVDLPWNPSRLEQRIGRIKRFGQTRERVDMANLSYAGTIDETIYRVISERLRTTNGLLGSLPETIEADWIDDINTIEERLRSFTVKRSRFDPFRDRYSKGLKSIDPSWLDAAEVFARSNVERVLSQDWITTRARSNLR